MATYYRDIFNSCTFAGDMDKSTVLKVLQIGKFHPIKGGVEKLMYSFTVGLSVRGICCDMLCASADGETGISTIIDGYSKLIKTKTVTKQCSTMLSPEMTVRLKAICHDYDIIHIHHPDPMAALALKLSGYRGKVVLHWHSDIIKQKALLKFFEPLQKWLVNRADLILGTSPVYIESSPNLKDVGHKTSYLPIGVREKTVDKNLTEMIRGQYPGKKIIFSMGRLIPYKGYEYLIEAGALLPDDYVILIGGSGALETRYRQLIHRHELHHKVILLGYIPRGMEFVYYDACDVFCLSSVLKTEAYGIVQVEAMQFGKPIIATEIVGSGVPWVNAHGISGLNVPCRSSSRIAEAIQQICSDQNKYAQFSKAARERFVEHFTLEAMLDRLLTHYSALLHKAE